MQNVRHSFAARALVTCSSITAVEAPVGGMKVGSVNGSVESFGLIRLLATPRLIMKRVRAIPVYTDAPFGAAIVNGVRLNLSLMNCVAASVSEPLSLLEWLFVWLASSCPSASAL